MSEIIVNKSQLVKLIRGQNIKNYSLEEIIDENLNEFDDTWFSLIIKDISTNKFYKTLFAKDTEGSGFSKLKSKEIVFDSEFNSGTEEITLTECKFVPTWILVD